MTGMYKPDLNEGRDAQHDEGRWRAKPGEAIVQMEMPGIGRAAGDEHRQKDAKAGRRGERHAQNNRERQVRHGRPGLGRGDELRNGDSQKRANQIQR